MRQEKLLTPDSNPEIPRPLTRALREYQVLRYIRPLVLNPIILRAFEDVDRGDFIEPQTLQKVFPYDNSIIQLEGKGASLSDPVLLALMIDALNLLGKEKVLDVGTGSGHMAAVLSRCSSEVHTIEYNEHLASGAAQRLEKLGFETVSVHIGDGAKGVPEGAPYDAIVVTAETREIPQALFDQLKDGGTIVAPTLIEGDSRSYLVKGIKRENTLHLSVLYEVSFHPLVSDEHGGWGPQASAKNRSYKIVFDDKSPKEFPNAQKLEVPEEKRRAAGLEVLNILGITEEYFNEWMKKRGWEYEAKQLILNPELLYLLIKGIKRVDATGKEEDDPGIRALISLKKVFDTLNFLDREE